MLRNAMVDSARRARPRGSRVPRLAFVVVARSHPGLHGYLTQCFSRVAPAIQVITDRRCSERRHRLRETAAERRRRNRRRLTGADDALRCHGYVVIGSDHVTWSL
jgi:hypothetical protein